jgi:putative transcriptional regulator
MTEQKKRNLFEELKQGIEDINTHKTGKITLRTHSIKMKPHQKVDAALIRETREELHMSQNVFALKLRVCSRTLEKWEQGKTIPNEQAAALILMVRKYPDTLKRLEEI